MVKIQKLPNGQLVITIPKVIADYEGLKKGMELEFKKHNDGFLLELKKNKRWWKLNIKDLGEVMGKNRREMEELLRNEEIIELSLNERQKGVIIQSNKEKLEILDNL